MDMIWMGGPIMYLKIPKITWATNAWILCLPEVPAGTKSRCLWTLAGATNSERIVPHEKLC